MTGRSKICVKKIGHHACLRVNDFSFSSELSLIGNLLLPGRARANDATIGAQ